MRSGSARFASSAAARRGRTGRGRLQVKAIEVQAAALSFQDREPPATWVISPWAWPGTASPGEDRQPEDRQPLSRVAVLAVLAAFEKRQQFQGRQNPERGVFPEGRQLSLWRSSRCGGYPPSLGGTRGRWALPEPIAAHPVFLLAGYDAHVLLGALKRPLGNAVLFGLLIQLLGLRRPRR
jgi:hypothetical protein